MKKSFWSRLAALLFCLTFAVCSLSISAIAADVDESKLPGYQVISERNWQLSPGVTESEIVLNNAAGTKRQVTHVVEVDMTNPYTKVIPSYYKMAEGLAGDQYQTQIMSEQAKYAEENGYGNVVAAMNTCLHWYDTEYYEQHPELIGEPLGTLILDGELYRNSQNSYFGAYTCIVINFDEKDGQPRPDNIPKFQVRQTYDAITGWEEQLIPASFHFLVKDGVNQHSVNDPEPAAPRTMMGVKADGTLVLVMVEGRQAPFSTGFNAYEMAEYMISLGCVQAINCDGGGSSTFLSERPGEDLELHCSPSDGAERPVAHGVLVISTDPNAHKHTPGEATDQAPTSTESGYIGRVFCTVCGMTMEEGTEIPATCHTYAVDMTNKKVVCECGCTFDKTGLQTVGGKTYYTVKGRLMGGWQSVNDEWYYFHPSTYAGADGEQYADNGVKFSFENGRLTDGTWVTTTEGKRYWYGPGYYRDTSADSNASKLCEIDGENYLFDRNGYVKMGIAYVLQDYSGMSAELRYYDCDENGVATLLTGPYNDYFYQNGVAQKAYQLVQDLNGNIYFISDGHKIAKNTKVYLTAAYVSGKTFPDGRAIPEGYHQFDADGKMVIPEMKHGVVGDYLYINDIKQLAYQLVEFEGDYYFVSDGHKIARNVMHYLTEPYVKGKTFPNGTAIPVGRYTFGADGKMILPEGVGPHTHTEAVDAAKAPTCTESGLTEGKHCLGCGEVLTAQTTIPANGHTEAVDAAKAPTCTESGLTEGKHCSVCGEVLTAQTAIPANGHTYLVDLVQKKMLCRCGAAWTDAGLQTVDGKTYCIVNGMLAEGWIELDGWWYYFDNNTLAGVNGQRYSDQAIPFTFENGRLVYGVWAKTKNGMRYWYGPGYYQDSSAVRNSSQPYEIEGKTYLFNRDGYMQTGIVESFNGYVTVYYDCGDDGVATLFTGADNGYYYLNGIRQKAYRLIQHTDGTYYFISDGHKIVMNKTVYLTADYVNGHTYADGTPLKVGYYTFGADGKMEIKSGVYDGYMYINNERVNRYALIKLDGDYYFVGDGRKIAMNQTVYLTAEYLTGYTYTDGTPLAPGYYTFGADGKMEIKHGVVDGYMYINGTRVNRYTLVDFEGALYFVGDGRKVAVNQTLYLTSEFVNGFTYPNGTPLTVGYYTFGADGKMVINEETVKNGVIDGYMYINNERVNRYCLVEFAGDFYFVGDGRKVAVNKTIYLTAEYVAGFTYADGTPLAVGYYTFDAEGKMVINNGIIDGYMYINNQKVSRYALIEFEGNFYFVGDGRKVAVNKTIYLTAEYVAGFTYADGTPLKAGYYTFDAEGKMVIVNGVVDGYMYINNERVNRYALIELDGNFYYVGDYRKVVTNKKQWLTVEDVAGKTWPDGSMIEVGYHYFDETGKMVY